MAILDVKCICPSCFNEINLGECKIVSGKTAGRVLAYPSKNRFGVWKVEPLDGPKYTLELARRQCTNRECNYILPPNIESVPSITLAVVGDTYSGKSHYIASLIHQIKAKWIGNAAGFARLNCLTPDVENYYTNEYFDVLFRRKQIIGLTKPSAPDQLTGIVGQHKPLIYKLAFSTSLNRLPKTINLMIYDVSGEDFATQGRFVDYARFAFTTNAFVFVIDPITIDSFFNELDPAIQPVFQNQFLITQNFRASLRLSETIDILESYYGLSSGSSLSNLPVAVMISKADLLQRLNPPYKLLSGHIFFNEPEYGHGVNLRDLDEVDLAARDVLKTFRQDDIFAATGRFRRLKFFATSATGESPDAGGYFQSVAPTRCLDPLLWILHQLKFIEGRK